MTSVKTVLDTSRSSGGVMRKWWPDAARMATPRTSTRSSNGISGPLAALASVILLMSGVADWFTKMQVGATSISALLTGLESLSLVALLLHTPRYGRAVINRAAPYFAFVAWSALTLAWAAPSLDGLQNLSVYFNVACCLTLGGTLSAQDAAGAESIIGIGIRRASVTLWAAVAINLLWHGLPLVDDPQGVPWFMSPRSIALVGVVCTAWYLAAWVAGRRRAGMAALMWLAVIAITMSRTAFATAIVCSLVAVTFQIWFRPSRVLRIAPHLIAASVIAALAIAGSIEFRAKTMDRLFGGDASIQVGGLRINAMGRLEFWRMTAESAREQPVLGKGLGSASVLVKTHFANVGHPHNDYLRIWHDTGVIGLGLFMVAVLTWLSIVFRRALHAARGCGGRPILPLAGALSLIGMLIPMATDNLVAYGFVMAPIALVTGAALGLRNHQRPAISPRIGALQETSA